MTCPFCNITPEEIILENSLAVARYDKYPVNRGHMLIIPRRHFADWFESTRDERDALLDLVEDAKSFLDREFNPDGYNLGINMGRSAGQTIFHLHIHLIPRYAGDMEDPKGGVRGVIPGKQKY